MTVEKSVNTEHLKADMVVMGCGGSGLVTALTAADNGVKNIIILEKEGHRGGNSALAGEFFACDSPVQAREGIVCRADDCFKLAMDWYHWDRVNPRLVRAYINVSGDTVRWLEGKGVEFDGKKLIKSQISNSTHTGKGDSGFGGKLISLLFKKCEEAGVKILLHTRGKKILRDAGVKFPEP